jgi:hypothetical protein
MELVKVGLHNPDPFRVGLYKSVVHILAGYSRGALIRKLLFTDRVGGPIPPTEGRP